MTFATLFKAELMYRWRSNAMAAAAVAVAVISVSCAFNLIEDFDRKTQSEVRALQDRSQIRMSALENEARVFTKSLGFNILVFHRDQELATFHAHDVNTHYLSTQQTRALAASNFAYLNHLLPFLRHRYALPAFGGDVIIAGLEGEIYIKRKFQSPLEVSIESGQVQLGHSVATKLGKQTGDTLAIGDRTYAITHTRDSLGTKDDLMVFMNLRDAQVLLNKPDQVSGILALSCNCAAGDIAPIRDGLKRIIPEADVVEFAVRARARQRARTAIKETVEAETRDILLARQGLRDQLSSFSVLFSSIMVLVAAALLAFLYHANVKERRHEIAILRTLGVRVQKTLLLFASKSFLLASIGSVVGYFAGILISRHLTGASVDTLPFNSRFMLECIGVSILISTLAILPPTLRAIRQEPGMVLNEEG